AVVHQPYIPAPPQIGVKSIVSSTLIAAMPNPANEHITLHTKEVVEWEFYDAYGRQVPQRSNSETIEITGWAAGLYYGIGKPSQPGKSVMYRTQFIKTR
ncbi:MAG: Secretion system C-terminal sorting domain, partial [Bacteroidota bacterium]